MSIDWPFSELDDEDGGDYFAWTAPEQLRCGDRLVLYEGGRGNRSSFIAISRSHVSVDEARHALWVSFSATMRRSR